MYCMAAPSHTAVLSPSIAPCPPPRPHRAIQNYKLPGEAAPVLLEALDLEQSAIPALNDRAGAARGARVASRVGVPPAPPQQHEQQQQQQQALPG